MTEKSAAPFKGEETMNITLHIPDSVARSLRVPEGEAEERPQRGGSRSHCLALEMKADRLLIDEIVC